MVLATQPMTGVSGRRWKLRGRFPNDALNGIPYEPLVRHLLWHRGIRSVDAAEGYLAARDPQHDIGLLPDLALAIDRLRRAMAEGERIAVYGDFDVDGVTATALLVESLRDLGAFASSYLPDRFNEGYGVHGDAIEKLAAEGVSLIVTADCGTSAAGEVDLARKLGVDVIVIDHHSTPADLPAAVALVNPKRPGNAYPEQELSSGGLAFRMMQALYEAVGRELDGGRYLDLVALSTVCDMAPLRGENRWLVREGLQVLARTQRPGLRALLGVAGCDASRVDADTIGYALGPRLNAAGRLEHAQLSLDLLMERDEVAARERAIALGALNQRRQQETQRSVELAEELLPGEADAPLLFIGHEDIPSGIVGLVAARLVDRYNRPAVVYERGPEESRASCRSIDEFDITGALRTVPHLMKRFGGHRAAAGFAAANENLPALKEALIRRAEEELRGMDPTPVIDIDASLPLHRVNGDLIRVIGLMAPFGVENPEPVFLSRDLLVTDVRVMGGDGSHLRLTLRDQDASWPAVAFGFADLAGMKGDTPLEAGQRLDVVYTFCADRRSGGALELRVADFALSV